VGTVTEIYDYYRLLYARIGIPHCPICGREIREQPVDSIIESILQMGEGTRVQLLAPVIRGKKGEHQKIIEDARKAGFARARIDGVPVELDESIRLDKQKKHSVDIIVDRLVIGPDIRSRLAESVETALQTSDGLLLVLSQSPDSSVKGVHENFFSQKNACPDCGVSIPIQIWLSPTRRFPLMRAVLFPITRTAHGTAAALKASRSTINSAWTLRLKPCQKRSWTLLCGAAGMK